ncbi:unnamed protein product [Prorocentrum cordatum]|uniref:AMP-dependent synthetase/ligase domain-containing protein n=1 Tax=Prorocentrum cordatum TaxID=2364126 RepID=A0ABN9SB56_9DINO|nr:unnamed protein product [Polarella glacialis]
MLHDVAGALRAVRPQQGRSHSQVPDDHIFGRHAHRPGGRGLVFRPASLQHEFHLALWQGCRSGSVYWHRWPPYLYDHVSQQPRRELAACRGDTVPGSVDDGVQPCRQGAPSQPHRHSLQLQLEEENNSVSINLRRFALILRICARPPRPPLARQEGGSAPIREPLAALRELMFFGSLSSSASSPAFFGERVVVHAVLAVGGAVGFYGGVRSPKVLEDIRELGPTFIVGTPSLLGAQIQNVRALHESSLTRFRFGIQRWALQNAQAEPGPRRRLARLCLGGCVGGWLTAPFREARAALLGRRSQPRFVLALCFPGSVAMPPEVCLWLRVVFGCRVLKCLVLAEAGGLATLGEAPYFGGALEAFAVGRALPGVYIEFAGQERGDLLENCCAPGAQRLRAGTMRVRGSFEMSRGDLRRRWRSAGRSRGSQWAPTPLEAGPPPDEGAAMEVMRPRVVGLCCEETQTVYVLGRTGSLEMAPSGCVVCDALEQLLCSSPSVPWLLQLMLTARGDRGVVGLGVVQLEHLWRLASRIGEALARGRQRGAALPKPGGAGVLPRGAPGPRQPAWGARGGSGEQPRALHLQLEQFSQEKGLQTSELLLRRDRIKEACREPIERLFDQLAEEASGGGPG